ncbi:mitochondrial inner membrane protein [Scheffersomyces xylosifermentans]|uniref:mitochondrial inner membrane protein n=1 Tax=Scheffersomyces xylosifermentans TaxID=1304137 RepID=UPI00315D6B3D
MIRTAARNAALKRAGATVRPLTVSSRVLQVKTTPVGNAPPPPPIVYSTEESYEYGEKKKGFSFTKLILNATLLASAAYGGTLYAATKNDKVMDYVIDKDLPYYEEIIDFIEHGSITDITGAIQDRIATFRLPSKSDIGELSKKIEHTGEDLYKETKRKLAATTITNKTDVSGAPTPAQQLQRPVEIESIKKDVEHLPFITLGEAVASSVDASVKTTIDSFNDLIESIDVSKVTPHNEKLIKTINESVSELSTKVSALTKKFDDELQSKLKVSQTELLSSFTKKELELTENLLHQFNREKAQLEAKLNTRLAQEVKATKEAISQAAVNAVSMVRIEQTKNFEKLIKDKINEERDGRLANLDKLSSKVDELEKFAESFEAQLVANHQKSVIHKSLTTLKALLFVSNPDEKPKAIKPYVDDLRAAASNPDDEVITLALDELTPLLAKESTQSILTTSQLLSRWEQLVPELRSASLLPPNAGLLGHLASIVFSKLLVSVKGSKPDGKDIESVIGRVEASLTRGELDVAVEEVANLKGWTRKLADDWVIEGRKRLEAEFLINLIEAESRIL